MISYLNSSYVSRRLRVSSRVSPQQLVSRRSCFPSSAGSNGGSSSSLFITKTTQTDDPLAGHAYMHARSDGERLETKQGARKMIPCFYQFLIRIISEEDRIGGGGKRLRREPGSSGTAACVLLSFSCSVVLISADMSHEPGSSSSAAADAAFERLPCMSCCEIRGSRHPRTRVLAPAASVVLPREHRVLIPSNDAHDQGSG